VLNYFKAKISKNITNVLVQIGFFRAQMEIVILKYSGNRNTIYEISFFVEENKDEQNQ